LNYFPTENLLKIIISENIFIKTKTNKELILKIEELEYMLFEYSKIKNKNFELLNYLFIYFWNLSNLVLDFNEFYERYILKNVLNLFRQKNGYQEGTYIKNWGKDKIEDNVFLTKYIDSGKPIEFNLIYDYLKNNYKKLNI
jgi:hypothetical protein